MEINKGLIKIVAGALIIAASIFGGVYGVHIVKSGIEAMDRTEKNAKEQAEKLPYDTEVIRGDKGIILKRK